MQQQKCVGGEWVSYNIADGKSREILDPPWPAQTMPPDGVITRTGGGVMWQCIPRQLWLLMVRQMQVVIEKNQAQPTRYAEIPAPFSASSGEKA